jgi:hypothetical protein
MAKTWTNRGLHAYGQGTLSTATLKLVALKGTAPSTATIRDYNFASEVIAGFSAGEAAASGYTRPTITVTFTEDDTNDRDNVAFSSPSFGAAVGTGETWTAVACINNAGANDAAHELYWVDVLAAGFPTNGSGVQYTGPTDTLTAP